MTALSVPNVSNRGRPSSFAGTTCRRDRSRISATAHQSTIRCRTDRSGSFRRRATHLRSPRPPATIPAYGRLTRRTPTRQQLATGACSNCPTEPFPGLPIGGERAFPLFTVSAPNSSQNGILLQKWRDRRPPRSRPLRRSRRGDVSPHHAPNQDAPTSSGGPRRASTCRSARRHAPPPQAHFLAAIVIGPPIWAASCTPTSSPFLSLPTGIRPFTKVFTAYVR